MKASFPRRLLADFAIRRKIAHRRIDRIQPESPGTPKESQFGVETNNPTQNLFFCFLIFGSREI